MKKVFTLVAVAGLFTTVACGPSAEEMAAKAKATADSIAAVESAKAAEEAAKMQAAADSTAKYAEEEAAKAQAAADSAAKAEEGKKGGKKK